MVARLRHLVTPHSHDTADKVDASWRPRPRRPARAVDLPGRPGRHRRSCRPSCRDLSGLGRPARRHPAQRRRRADRRPAGHRVRARPAPADPPVHLRLRPGRGPGRHRHRRGHRRVRGRSPATRRSTGCSTRATSPTSVRSPPPRVIGFVGNEVVARYRIRVGRRIGSAALVADGLHARTDGFTSLAVLRRRGRCRRSAGAGPTRSSAWPSRSRSCSCCGTPPARSTAG